MIACLAARREVCHKARVGGTGRWGRVSLRTQIEEVPMADERETQASAQPEPYPPVRQDDAVERTGRDKEVRSFDPPDEGEADASRDGGQKRFEGPQADPAEGRP